MPESERVIFLCTYLEFLKEFSKNKRFSINFWLHINCRFIMFIWSSLIYYLDHWSLNKLSWVFFSFHFSSYFYIFLVAISTFLVSFCYFWLFFCDLERIDWVVAVSSFESNLYFPILFSTSWLFVLFWSLPPYMFDFLVFRFAFFLSYYSSYGTYVYLRLSTSLSDIWK